MALTPEERKHFTPIPFPQEVFDEGMSRLLKTAHAEVASEWRPNPSRARSNQR